MIPLPKTLTARPGAARTAEPGSPATITDGARLVFVALGTAVLYGAALHHSWHYTIDEAAISAAYAVHMVDGHGLVANVGGPRVEGFSNPLWVLLLALAYAVGVEPILAAKTLGVGLGGVALVLAGRLVQVTEGRACRDVRAHDLVPAAIACSLTAFTRWMPAGLENGLLACLLGAMLLADLRERARPRRFPLAATLAVAVAATRPEGVAYGLALGGLRLLDSRGATLRDRGRLLRDAGVFALGVGLLHLARGLYFGTWVTNTYWAKQSTTLDDGLTYLLRFWRQDLDVGMVVLAAIGLGSVPLWRWRADRFGGAEPPAGWYPRCALAAVLAVGLAFPVWAGGDRAMGGRLFTPAAVAIGVLAALGVGALAATTERWTPGRPRAAVASVLLSALVILDHVVLDRSAARQDHRTPCHYCPVLAQVEATERLRDSLGVPVARLATTDFGAPSLASSAQLRGLDLLGLRDPVLAHYAPSHRLDSGVRDRHRYRHVFHEQPAWPLFLNVYGQTWRGLRASPEWHLGYAHRHDVGAPRTRGIHRGAFVDYFPDIDRLQRIALTDSVDVVGSTVRTGGAPHALGVTVWLTTRTGQSGPILLQAKLSRRPERQGIESAAKALWFARHWLPGEPYRVDLELEADRAGLPRSADFASVDLELGLCTDGDSWHWITTRAAPSRAPRSAAIAYPSALPEARHPTLRSMQNDVRQLVRRGGSAVTRDPRLADALRRAAHTLEAGGELDQAYLAAVWATHADNSLLAALHTDLDRLRSAVAARDWTLEIRLLRRFFAEPDRQTGAALLAFYEQLGAELKATRCAAWLRAMPAAQPRPMAVEASVTRGAAAALTFEDTALSAWHGNGAVRRVRVDANDPAGIRGHQGEFVLSSADPKGRPRVGTLRSPPLRLAGSVLSVRIAGNADRKRCGIELICGGETVWRASGLGGGGMHTEICDIRPWRGRIAELRVYDRDPTPGAFVAVDAIRTWP